MKNTFKISMLALIISLMFMYSATSQEYKIVGNQIVKVKGSDSKLKPVKTELTYTIKGKVYPVYKSIRGNYFIIRTSKKTGKTYNQYLKIN